VSGFTHNDLQRIVDSSHCGRERLLAETIIRERAAHMDHVRRAVKEAMFAQTYGASPERVRDLLGVNFNVMARADYALTLMVAPPTSTNENKFWVEVVKNRRGNPSRHAFRTLQDALDYMKEFVG
jgi:hypothetical protein